MNKKNPMKIVILIAIVIIPIMYSFFYLKAFWDPYNNLKDMNVALLNLDKGDETSNLGSDLVNTLKDKNVMNFTELKNKEDANSSLIDEKYYAVITIPEDFTLSLHNAGNKDRNTVLITYSPNQKSNYLASQIISKVVTGVEKDLRSKIGKEVTSTLSEKLNDVPNKLQDVSNGSAKLQSGSISLQNGVSTLHSGTNSLKQNYTTFNSKISEAYTGSMTLNNGVISLSNGIDSISNGVNTLNNSTKSISTLTSSASMIASKNKELATGTSKYVNTVNSSLDNVTNSISTISSDVTSLVSSHPELMADSNFQKLISDLKASSSTSNSISSLKEAGNNIKESSDTLNTNIQMFSTKSQDLNKIPTAISDLSNGINKLKDGSNNLKEGSSNLSSGLNSLNTASNILLNGISTLDNGTNSLLVGSNELVNGTSTFKNTIDNNISSSQEELKNLDGLDSYVENPVEIDEEDYGKVSSYGIGFTPYFISISLWVGGLIMIIILYYDPADRFKKLGRNAKNKFLRTALYAVIGVAQGIILGVVLKICLKFSVTNLALYYFTCVLISLTFLSIIHFLLVYFKDIGKFLSILLLVLQLAASGGTFPIETVPKFFQKIYALVPMNYSIRLIKESIIELNMSIAIKNIIILSSICIFFFGMSFIIDFMNFKKSTKPKKHI